jgi:hypothetical protein
MMSTDLNNLGLKPNDWDVDFDNLPEGFGAAYSAPPQPGTYTFQMPGRVQIEKSFEIFDHPEQGKRLRCTFRDDTALMNVTLNQSYNANISNVVRIIAPKSGRQPFKVSDMASLLKALGSIPANGTIEGYQEALLAAAEGIFLADSTLSATCNSMRDTYGYDETLGKSVLRPGIKGCGQRFRTEAYTPSNGSRPIYAIPRDETGKFELRFTCPCGADVRAWPQLQGFRHAK